MAVAADDSSRILNFDIEMRTRVEDVSFTVSEGTKATDHALYQVLV